MRSLILFIITLIPFYFFSQENDDSIRHLLDSISKNHIKSFSNGDMDSFINNYSKEYTDLGGGMNGDGTINFDEWKAKLKAYALSKDFKKIKGKPVDEILDIDKQEILNYTETVAKKGEIKKFSFQLKKGDYYILYPPKEDSPMFDGWFGIFRLENNNWKIIAGD